MLRTEKAKKTFLLVSIAAAEAQHRMVTAALQYVDGEADVTDAGKVMEAIRDYAKVAMGCLMAAQHLTTFVAVQRDAASNSSKKH